MGAQQENAPSRIACLGCLAVVVVVLLGLGYVVYAFIDDLDAPRAVAAIEAWAVATREGATDDPGAGATIRTLADATLGLRL